MSLEFFDLESDLGPALRSELRAVAEGVQVPGMPPLPLAPAPVESRHGGRYWVPLLVGAVVVLVIAGAVAMTSGGRGSHRPQPAQPKPTPTAIPTTVPPTPYLLGPSLHVDGQLVAGQWMALSSASGQWLAMSMDRPSGDRTWAWGDSASPVPIEGTGEEDIPVLSSSGEFIAYVDSSESVVTAFSTKTGESLGSEPVELGDPDAGDPVGVAAVTDDGLVVVQGLDTSLLWRPAFDGSVVDLSETAPGVRILGSTPAGVIANVGDDTDADQPYLATLDEDGALTKVGDLPPHDNLKINREGGWMAWTPYGTTAGEVTTTGSLEISAVDGSRRMRLAAPKGYAFAVRSWSWAYDDHLVATVKPADDPLAQRIARCSAEAGKCVLVASD